MLYSYAKLSRFDFGFFRVSGSGLGNMLFPWARFIIATEKFQLRPIAPTWPALKVGPILRWERDARLYTELFRTPTEMITGFEKLLLLFGLPRIPEAALVESFSSSYDACQNKSGVIIFHGLMNCFNDILYEHELIHQKFVDMTLDVHKQGIQFNFDNAICLHVRLGDFKIGKQTTDMQWFVNAVISLRKRHSNKMRAYVFSDGSDDELQPLLRLENVRRLSFGSSIADMLALSKSRILVGSRNSTFGMWACYLGRMPAIFPPGGWLQPLYYEAPTKFLQWNENSDLPEEFLGHCECSLLASNDYSAPVARILLGGQRK